VSLFKSASTGLLRPVSVRESKPLRPLNVPALIRSNADNDFVEAVVNRAVNRPSPSPEDGGMGDETAKQDRANHRVQDHEAERDGEGPAPLKAACKREPRALFRSSTASLRPVKVAPLMHSKTDEEFVDDFMNRLANRPLSSPQDAGREDDIAKQNKNACWMHDHDKGLDEKRSDPSMVAGTLGCAALAKSNSAGLLRPLNAPARMRAKLDDDSASRAWKRPSVLSEAVVKESDKAKQRKATRQMQQVVEKEQDDKRASPAETGGKRSRSPLRPMSVPAMTHSEPDDSVQAVLRREWSRPPSLQNVVCNEEDMANQTLDNGEDQDGRKSASLKIDDKLTSTESPASVVGLQAGHTATNSRCVVDKDRAHTLGGGSLPVGVSSYPGEVRKDYAFPVNFGCKGSRPSSPHDSPASSGCMGSQPDGSEVDETGPHDEEASRKLKRPYTFDICALANGGLSPKLRSPPVNRRGCVKLVFEPDMLEGTDSGSVDDAKVNCADDRFKSIACKLHGFVSQTCVRMNDIMIAIKNRNCKEPTYFTKSKMHFETLLEVEFLIGTVNYYMAKAHHQLEPGQAPVPVSPARLADSSVDDLLSQIQSAVSTMGVLSGKLCPLLEQIVSDAKTNRRRGLRGEALSPALRHPASLAAKRGLCNVAHLHKIPSHLEKILATTQSLAIRPQRESRTLMKA